MQTHRLGRKEGYSPGLIGSISITVGEEEVEVEVRVGVLRGEWRGVHTVRLKSTAG